MKPSNVFPQCILKWGRLLNRTWGQGYSSHLGRETLCLGILVFIHSAFAIVQRSNPANEKAKAQSTVAQPIITLFPDFFINNWLHNRGNVSVVLNTICRLSSFILSIVITYTATFSHVTFYSFVIKQTLPRMYLWSKFHSGKGGGRRGVARNAWVNRTNYYLYSAIGVHSADTDSTTQARAVHERV